MSTADSTAAFFAKKKKKKAYKGFNANLIDASSVTTTVHVDAPAVSTDPNAGGLTSALASASLNGGPGLDQETGADQWDDAALAAATARKGAAPTSQQQTAELLDMKTLDTKHRVEDNIAERMRVEETKAALAAAREGMEREAQRLKENEEQQETEAAAASKSRFGAAVAPVGGGAAKWVAPHMRAGTAASLTHTRMGGASSKKLDTKDENLFPDLAAADAILEQQQKQEQTAYKVPKKTPVGGGASWASSRPGGALRTASASKPAPTPEPSKPEPAEEPKPTPAPATAPAPAAPKPIKPAGIKKKKKKDLSTFKPSS